MKTVRRVAMLLLAGLAAAAPSARAQRPDSEPLLPREVASALPLAGVRSPGTAQNPLLGGVPAGEVTAGRLPLSLADALARSLEHNLGIILATEAQHAATAGRWNTLGGVLPSLGLRAGQSRQEINLAEFGFPVQPGQSPIIGPFNVAAVHLSATAPIFDYAAIQAARAGGLAVEAATHSLKDTRDLVVSLTAGLYLEAVTAGSRIDAARAQLATAQAIYDRAVNMKQAGVVAGIDVLRAQVQLQAQEQRLIFYENERAKQHLVLKRAIGIPLAQDLDLTDQVSYAPLDPVPLDEYLTEALATREDLAAAEALVRVAEAGRQAAIGAMLPSIRMNADLGRSGSAWDGLLGTYSISAAVQVPIFQGGREHARRIEADARLKQERAQAADLRARIEYEVRAALLDVQAADRRLHVAESASTLAADQLTQARDRFAAGVSSNIEVVQAQEAVATATENHLSALYAHNLAKIALARALGIAGERLGQFLGRTK